MFISDERYGNVSGCIYKDKRNKISRKFLYTAPDLETNLCAEKFTTTKKVCGSSKSLDITTWYFVKHGKPGTASHEPRLINALRPRQNGRLFADDTFKRIFLNENIIISIKISLKFVPKGLINNIPALVLIMAWRRPGDKPLSEPMLVRSLTHICVTRPQWVNEISSRHSHFSANLWWHN